MSPNCNDKFRNDSKVTQIRGQRLAIHVRDRYKTYHLYPKEMVFQVYLYTATTTTDIPPGFKLAYFHI